MAPTGSSDDTDPNPPRQPTVTGARLVLPVDDLQAAVDGLTAIGFRLLEIGPADEPTSAVVDAGGFSLRLHTDSPSAGPDRVRPVGVELDGSDGAIGPTDLGDADVPEALASLLVPPSTVPAGPPPSIQDRVISHEAAGDWVVGRAGMRYRDLIPARHGGAFIASHIHVPGAGPVPDLVHHHDVVFQMIFCHRGRVTVAYQDQGPPFTLEPGDCVLQPPGIRHRVLESADDLHVVEITCPAVHRTSIDHSLDLPTAEERPGLTYGGQRFVHHRSARSRGEEVPPVEPLGLDAATRGLARAAVHHLSEATEPLALDHEADLLLAFVLGGAVVLDGPEHRPERLVAGSSVTALPAGGDVLRDAQPGTEVLVVEVGPLPTS